MFDSQNKEGATKTLNSLLCSALQMIITLECLYYLCLRYHLTKASVLLLSLIEDKHMEYFVPFKQMFEQVTTRNSIP